MCLQLGRVRSSKTTEIAELAADVAGTVCCTGFDKTFTNKLPKTDTADIGSQ